ncbi:MAG: CPBP family intramembrane metalloprotease [Pirellulaceae bacterium]|nr:CPBP family intramembrane metalloprotease [Pirellulaceae bacterium]
MWWESNGTLTGGRTLSTLVAAIVVASFSQYMTITAARELFPGCESVRFSLIGCLHLALLAGLPFLLARLAPRAAGFDAQWLPGARRQWAWFLGMVFLLFLSKAFVAALAATFLGRPTLPTTSGRITPIGVVFSAIVVVLIAPVAEEIFFRGYLLEQLRKLTHTGTSNLIQATVFALFHVYGWGGAFSSYQLVTAGGAFLCGLIWGAWRVKFRCLLPLVLAHMLYNSTVIVPLRALYDQVSGSYDTQCHQIDVLTKEPIEKTAPEIIRYFSDTDETLRFYAMVAPMKHYGPELERFLKDALASKDRNVVVCALFIVQFAGSVDRFPGQSGARPWARRESATAELMKD